MKKMPIILFTAGLTLTLATTVFALTDETVQALLNRRLIVEYNGRIQSMTDANGKSVYPLTYNDSTYLPVRAICDILGVDIEWDADNYRVVIKDDISGDSTTVKGFRYGFTSFYEPGRGYRLEAVDHAAGNEYHLLYKTPDGINWKTVDTNLDKVYSRNATAFIFTDEDTGFIGFRAESGDFLPAIMKTGNGGKTWEKLTAVSELCEEYTADDWMLTPDSFALNGGVIKLTLTGYRDSTAGRETIALVLTSANGENWSEPAELPYAESNGWKIFVSGSSYTLTDGSSTYTYSPDENAPFSFNPVEGLTDHIKLLAKENDILLVYPAAKYESANGVTVAENGLLIDAATGEITCQPSFSGDDIIALFDYDGTLADKIGDCNITCEPLLKDGYYPCLNYTLTTTDSENILTATAYLKAGTSWNDLTLTPGRAVIGKDTQKLIPYYDRAYEASGLLEVSFISVDWENTYAITKGGIRYPYGKVTDKRFEENGIKTLVDFRNYLRKYFTKEMVASLLPEDRPNDPDYIPYFIEKDGAIYAVDAARGSNASTPSVAYRASGDKLTVEEFYYPDYEYHRGYTLNFVKSGDVYLCANTIPLLY